MNHNIKLECLKLHYELNQFGIGKLLFVPDVLQIRVNLVPKFSIFSHICENFTFTKLLSFDKYKSYNRNRIRK